MKTVIEMAQEAGFETILRKGSICGFDRDGDYTEEIEALAELIRADLRETLLQNSMQAHEVEAFRDVVPCTSIRARSNT